MWTGDVRERRSTKDYMISKRNRITAGFVSAALAAGIFMGSCSGALAAADTVKVTGKYKDIKVTKRVRLTDSSSMEVHPKEDYIKVLKIADLGSGLKMKVRNKDDYMRVRQVETSDARLKNEDSIRRAKAGRRDRAVIAEAQRQADAKAEKKYKNIWELPSVSMGLPEGTSGETKTYMDYTAVTSKGSDQYKLLHSGKAYTKDGFRMYDGYYCVAMGSYYSDQIGTKFYVELSNGKTLRCILGDRKSDKHTNDTHQYAEKNKDILEFIVDGISLSGGDVSEIEGFEGSVASIRKITDDHTNTFPYGYEGF